MTNIPVNYLFMLIIVSNLYYTKVYLAFTSNTFLQQSTHLILVCFLCDWWRYGFDFQIKGHRIKLSGYM